MDLLDDDLLSEPVVKAPATSRFKPKAKARPKNGPSKAAHSTVTDTKEKQPDVLVEDKSEAPTNSSPAIPEDNVGVSTTKPELPGNQSISETLSPDVPSIQNEKEIPVSRDVSFSSSSPSRPCTSQTAHDYFMPSPLEDSEDFQINVEQLEAGDFSCLDAVENEGIRASGTRASKLKPKPKAQDKSKDTVETFLNLSNAPQLSFDNQPDIDGSVHVGGPYSLQDAVDDSFPTSRTTDQSQNVVFEDLDMLEQDEEPVLSREANENTSEFVDGISDEVQMNSESHTNAHDESASKRGEDDNNADLDIEKPKKTRGRKPKNVGSESENDNKRARRSKKASKEADKSASDKPSRKSKRVSQTPDESVVKPPKKFPRATRRKRRVDPMYLVDDDIDLHKLPIKELILLGEHKDREAKKQAALLPPQATNERIDNLEPERDPYDDDGDEDQERDLSHVPSTSGVQTDTGYYNYHSHRNTQPRAKWSKQDTEMFYQGIRQFGTDLSMIQQLFPGRSLEQIRSKFRKEQKQNPMAMDDAQATRATDNSCFELVIKTLEAARAAQEKEYAYSDEEDVAHPTDKQGNPEDDTETHATATPHEAAKSEQKLEEQTGGEELDRSEVASPGLSDNDDIWANYE